MIEFHKTVVDGGKVDGIDDLQNRLTDHEFRTEELSITQTESRYVSIYSPIIPL